MFVFLWFFLFNVGISSHWEQTVDTPCDTLTLYFNNIIDLSVQYGSAALCIPFVKDCHWVFWDENNLLFSLATYFFRNKRIYCFAATLKQPVWKNALSHSFWVIRKKKSQSPMCSYPFCHPLRFSFPYMSLLTQIVKYNFKNPWVKYNFKKSMRTII
jgi:hypothetical protein